MNIQTIQERVNALQQELQQTFPTDTIVHIFTHQAYDHFHEYTFNDGTIRALTGYGSIPLMVLEMYRTNNEEEAPSVFYTKISLDGFTIPLRDDGNTDIMQLSVRFSELETGDIDIDHFVVNDEETYQEVLEAFWETVHHHAHVIGLPDDVISF